MVGVPASTPRPGSVGTLVETQKAIARVGLASDVLVPEHSQVARVWVLHLRVDAESAKCSDGVFIERSHRLTGQRKRHSLTRARADDQLMGHEVEVDSEDWVGAHRTSRDASTGQVERHIPPVVASHTGGEPDLAHHLGKPGGGTAGLAGLPPS